MKKLRFVGYCKNSKGYRLFDEETRKGRDVIFDETVFVFNKPVTEQKNTTFDVGEETHQPQDDTEQPQDEPQDDTQQSEERRRSQRARGPPVRFGVDEFANTTEADHMAYVSQIKEPDARKRLPDPSRRPPVPKRGCNRCESPQSPFPYVRCKYAQKSKGRRPPICTFEDHYRNQCLRFEYNLPIVLKLIVDCETNVIVIT